MAFREPTVEPEAAIRTLIRWMGDNPHREGLQDTPARVLRSYHELFSGYGHDPETILCSFEDGTCNEMVLLKDVEFYSTCEHHLLPFVGRAHIAYLPNGVLTGVSKLARLLEVFSRRLQIQERLASQVANALMESKLKPLGAACILEASHLCMSCRGVNKQQSKMVTSAIRGEFLKPEVRQELLALITL